MSFTTYLYGAAVVAAMVTPARAADRMTDRDVAALVNRIDEARDRFEDALDDKVKHDVVRGPTGEVDVERYLDDFQTNVDRLEDRLKPDYAASAEVATVLRQASAIDAFFRLQPPGLQGQSEWNRLATELKSLAAAYGAEFPLAEPAAVRRVGDRELANIADELSKGADQLKKSLDGDLKKDTSIDVKTRQSLVNEAAELSRDAKTVRDRLKDGQPSSAEADRLLTRAAKVQAIVEGHKVPAAVGSWEGVTPRVRDLAAAYRVTWAGGR